LIGVRQAWSAKIAEVGFALEVAVVGRQIVVASSDGGLLALDGVTGSELWRTNITERISAGVGSDGRLSAVVTHSNLLVGIEAGRELWRTRLGTQVFTRPLVAGKRVFVLGADRSVSAFDGQTGQRLWTVTRPGEPLILRQQGVLTAVGDTLVAGLSGRLLGLNPSNGATRWEAPVATPRGTNDVERLVDLVGPVSRHGTSVCVRAFQTTVGCVDAATGALTWTRSSVGATGLHGDDRLVVGTEADGKVIAWRRTDGERLWSTDRFQYRGLTAPLVLGRSLVVGDASGLALFLSREDGSLLHRMPTDGTSVVAAPVQSGETLVVVTRSGGIYGFRPE
jgi:outer membrane assembly lipoprotein YfgL